MDTDHRSAALARALREIARAIETLADELSAPGASTSSTYGPASTRLPWSERVLRQSLIIQDIVEAGGKVTRDEWYAIAAKYGYQGRGLAGFFREGKAGLLEMREDMVLVTPSGRKRLAENARRVEAERNRTSESKRESES